MGESVENVRRKMERLTDLPGRASSAIGNDICRHGRAVLAVTAINFLDHAFTPVAARQIEIDVGPAFASFTQKTFEDEMIAHRIDRSDAKAKTNHTVRRAPPALDHDLVFAAEIDDV